MRTKVTSSENWRAVLQSTYRTSTTVFGELVQRDSRLAFLQFYYYTQM